MMDSLEKLRKLRDTFSKDVQEFANSVIENDNFIKGSGSGSPNRHHFGEGQLVVHTCEVVEIALLLNEYFGKPCKPHNVFLAALYHDYGKIHDYKLSKNPETGEVECEYTEHKKLFSHVYTSASFWENNYIHHIALNGDFNDDDHREILHAILAHHGIKAYGSPVVPATKLALIVHHADSISARMNDIGKYDK